MKDKLRTLIERVIPRLEFEVVGQRVEPSFFGKHVLSCYSPEYGLAFEMEVTPGTYYTTRVGDGRVFKKDAKVRQVYDQHRNPVGGRFVR